MTRIMPMVLVVLAAVILEAVTLPTGPALAGPNANASIILHAVALTDTALPPCAIADPCLPEPGHPGTQIDFPGKPHVIYVLVRHHQRLCGLQWAFEWPADWFQHFSLWTCQPGALYGWPPMPQGPGPLNGSVSAAFNCVDGPALAVIGFIYMLPGSGCLEVIESAFPDGTHAMGPGMEIDPIQENRRGRVCVGPGGLNTCDPLTPVEPETWGAIKATFSRSDPPQYEGRGEP